MRGEARRAGSAMLSALGFTLVISIMMSGVCWFTVSHQQRAEADNDYAAALDIAEAGVNYELRDISNSISNADQTPGVTVGLGGGSFTVYVANSDGTTPWSGGSTVLIVSKGVYHTCTRTVNVTCQQQGAGSASYAIYAGNSATFHANTLIWNDLGTNGTLSLGSNMWMLGDIYLNGTTGSYPGFTVHTNPSALSFATIDQAAAAYGGLSYLATHNDNATASPAITNNTINGNVTLYGKPGGANYYLTNCSLPSNKTITLNNNSGPINVWLSASATMSLNDGDVIIPTNWFSSNQATFYVSTSVTMHDSNIVDATIVVNGSTGPNDMTVHDSNALLGMFIVGHNFTAHDNFAGVYLGGTYQLSSYFGYGTAWSEANPR